MIERLRIVQLLYHFHMSSRRWVAVLGVVALIVLGGGCVALNSPSNGSAENAENSDHEPDPEAVFEGAFVHSDDLEDVRGEVRTEVRGGNETVTERLAVAERPYVDYRDEVLDASNPDRVGDIYVSNATTTWWYYPDREVAEYFEADEPFDSEEVRSFRADEADRQADLYEFEYRGTERVADREAHVLDVELKDEAVTEGLSVLVGDTEYVYALETIDPSDELTVVEQRIWIDAEFEYPLKERLVFEGPDGDRHVMIEEYETISFNVGLDDETFAFEPPKNTTVEEV